MLGSFAGRRPTALLLLLGLARADNAYFIIDSPLYQSLPSCPKNVISSAINTHLDQVTCTGDGVIDLKSCICLTSFNALSSSVRQDISSACGSARSDYQSSAYRALTGYCRQEASLQLATSTYSSFTSYMYELDAYQELAPCAQSAAASVLRQRTSMGCPPQRSIIATCLCESDRSAAFESAVETAVEGQCSQNEADVTSMLDVFRGYCLLNSGTESMPVQTDPPGDMTYYMTDMDQFKDLNSCAQTALDDALMDMTRNLCPSNGPEALASCACIKSGVSEYISKSLTTQVIIRCSSTTSDFLSSATEVLHLYCSAARGQTELSVETGVSSSSSGGGSLGPERGVIVGAILGSFAGFAFLIFVIAALVKRRTQMREWKSRQYKANPVELTTVTTDGAPRAPEGVLAPPEHDEAAPPPYEPGRFGEVFARTQRRHLGITESTISTRAASPPGQAKDPLSDLT